MNLRHLATKGFDSDIIIRRSLMYPGTPLAIGIIHREDSSTGRKETIQFNKSMSDSVNLAPSLLAGKESLLNSPLSGILIDSDEEIYPLSACYDYEVQPRDKYSEFLPVGTTFDSIFEAQDTRERMAALAADMFHNDSPYIGEPDINQSDFYTPYVPLVVLTGCMTPQMRDGEAYFNPNGVVTVAEFLDGLNAIKFGCNANNRRRKTLDNISTEADYFNEGYNSVLRNISSPFFNLYTREELVTPITRLELAYITVVCWSQFMEKYNSLYGGAYYLGVTFDWEAPFEVLSRYKDGFDYKVSRISLDDERDVTSLNIKDYRSDRSMFEYREDMRHGIAPLPLPMFMSMLELGVLDLFYYSDFRLDPLKEVSRGELCYFLARISKHFPTKRI